MEQRTFRVIAPEEEERRPPRNFQTAFALQQRRNAVNDRVHLYVPPPDDVANVPETFSSSGSGVRDLGTSFDFCPFSGRPLR